MNKVEQAFCFKCRTKVDVRNPTALILKSKRPATKGTCPKCSTTVFRIDKSRGDDRPAV
ncbi:DUF5679 domain-containing protein [Chloroflexota bacterium]